MRSARSSATLRTRENAVAMLDQDLRHCLSHSNSCYRNEIYDGAPIQAIGKSLG